MRLIKILLLFAFLLGASALLSSCGASSHNGNYGVRYNTGTTWHDHNRYNYHHHRPVYYDRKRSVRERNVDRSKIKQRATNRPQSRPNRGGRSRPSKR